MFQVCHLKEHPLKDYKKDTPQKIHRDPVPRVQTPSTGPGCLVDTNKNASRPKAIDTRPEPPGAELGLTYEARAFDGFGPWVCGHRGLDLGAR